MSAAPSRYLIIHGHFYQPPRENPWTEAIERQPSAAPYHDWNERVAAECYHPNAFSRILSPFQERIARIVNNYTSISFNFGPTLLAWMERHTPEAYHRILEADRHSMERFSGHGNAIAQAYNHMILPLASERDQVTQVRWGLADFRHRFGREAEAMWLPETAINSTTLRTLCDHGLRFVILSPHQAQRVRSLDSTGEWTAVENGEIDTSRAYRCFVADANGHKHPDRFIDVVFYHGALSVGVGFEHLLRDARYFADRIESSFPAESDDAALVSIATDGESYGHHEPFGDMALAYLLHVEAPHRGLHVTNFGEYLDRMPPRHEVELKLGPGGEGTAWSCAHGVGRWYRDCGCNSGGHPEWNQSWREPLRQAFDWLRDDLAGVYEEQAAAFFADPWAARDAYIDVILDRRAEALDRFFSEQGVGRPSASERVRALKLLEMQRHTLLMYTSCGWFFDELSGIETVQVIRYAARAVQLAEALGVADLERRFLARLRAAKSNLPEYRDGARIYQRLVKPSVIHFPKIVSHFAIRSLLDPSGPQQNVYHYTISAAESAPLDDGKRQIGIVEVKSGITTETGRFGYLLDTGSQEYDCWVRPLPENVALADLAAETSSRRKGTTFQKRWSTLHFTLLDMLFEDRERIMGILIKQRLVDVTAGLAEIFEKHRDLTRQLRHLHLPIPEELSLLARYVLSSRLTSLLAEADDAEELLARKEALQIVEEARHLGLELDTERAAASVARILERGLEELHERPEADGAHQIERVLELANRLGLRLPMGRLQERLVEVIEQQVDPAIDALLSGSGNAARYRFASDVLRIAYRLHFDIRPFKSRLQDMEQRLSQDPDYWP